MRELVFDAPVDADWPAVLEIANASVADVAETGTQEEWLANRRDFARPGGEQHHAVARDAGSGALLGYTSVERDADSPPGGYRVFVVVRPDDLDSVGEQLLGRPLRELERLAATQVWFSEYAGDARLLGFACRHDFRPAHRIAWRGHQLAVMVRDLAGETPRE